MAASLRTTALIYVISVAIVTPSAPAFAQNSSSPTTESGATSAGEAEGQNPFSAIFNALRRLGTSTDSPPSPSDGDSESSAERPSQDPEFQVASASPNPCSEDNAQAQQVANAIIGAVAGAVIGGILGALIDRSAGNRSRDATRAGALLGAGAGVFFAFRQQADVARRECELHKIAQAHRAESSVVTVRTKRGGDDSAIQIAIAPDQGHFFEGTADLTKSGEMYYRAVAKQYTMVGQRDSFEQSVRDYAARNQRAGYQNYSMSPKNVQAYEDQWRELRILLVGHTDDRGDPEFQLELSERRAKAIALLFSKAGVFQSQLFYQGAGAAFPIADNNIPTERNKNNRVEVIAIYGGDAVLDEYASKRSGNYGFFSPRESNDGPVVTESTSPGVATAPQISESGSSPAATVAPPRPPIRPRPSPPKVPAARESAPGTGPDVVSPSVVVDNSIDFGGIPVSEDRSDLSRRVGRLRSNDGFSIAGLFGVSTANASPFVANCSLDSPARYRPKEIKRLSNDSGIGNSRRSTRDYYPALFKTSFTATGGKHLVAVKEIGVLRTGEVADLPVLNVYKEYSNPNAKPDMTLSGDGLAFVGENGVLFRQFFSGESTVKCLDVVFPPSAKFIGEGKLYYQRANGLNVATLPLSAPRSSR